MCLKARYRIPTHVYFMSADVLFYPGQDRIPMSSSSTTAPPPYPMKLAPANHQTGKSNTRHALFFFQIKTADHQIEDPDSQLIRAETCVFLVKLPRYCRYWLFSKDMMFLWLESELVRKSRFGIFLDSLSNMVLVTTALVRSWMRLYWFLTMLTYQFHKNHCMGWIPRPPFKCSIFAIHHLFPCSGTQATR